MRTQQEKNREALIDEIEKYSSIPITDSIAERLNVYFGALEALRMLDREKAEEKMEGPMRSKYSEKAEAFTPELDGDTEFERILMRIPADREHMVKLAYIFNRHLEDLKFANIRAYNHIIDQIKEIARY